MLFFELASRVLVPPHDALLVEPDERHLLDLRRCYPHSQHTDEEGQRREIYFRLAAGCTNRVVKASHDN